MSKRPWSNTDYPWEVGHRLKRSQRVLQYAKARKYFAKLAHCKTRFMAQKVPLDVLFAWSVRRKYGEMVQFVTEKNAILERVRKRWTKN